MRNKLQHYFFTTLFALSCTLIWGQNEFEIRNTNQIFDQQIRTVKFHLNYLPTSQPIIDFRSNTTLQLSFDDMTEEAMNYYYTIYHCDAEWNHSDIDPLEYMEVFEEGEIRSYYFSGITRNSYVHYRIQLPNEEVNWKISGNYMLIVYYYDDNEMKIPVLSRRFMVVNKKYTISTKFLRPNETQKLRTHHEVQVTIDVQRKKLRIPQEEIRLFIYQNGRWDRNVSNAIYNRFLGDEYYFNLPGMFCFPSSKEFRSLDNRFINSPSGKIVHFERNEDGYLALLYPDVPRTYAPYITYFDLNGQYVIMDREANFRNVEVITYDDYQDGDSTLQRINVENQSVNIDPMCLSCEYVHILFTLKVDHPYKNDVYVYGELTGWSLDPLFKMEFDPSRNAYFAKIQLKQGYYDYQFALDTKDGIDTETIEGLSAEGENDYLFLVYDRHPFNRGDRLVGVKMVNSNR